MNKSLPLCKVCDGTGLIDSGGILPWGEAAMLPCPVCSNFMEHQQASSELLECKKINALHKQK